MEVTKNTVVMRVIGRGGYHRLIFAEQYEDKICLEPSLFKSILRGLGAKLLEGDGVPEEIKMEEKRKDQKGER